MSMETTPKSATSSKTVQGALIASVPALVILLQQFGIDLQEHEVTQIFTSIIGLAGVVMAIYGRFKAKQPISL